MTTVYCTKGHDNQDSNRFCQICGEKLNPPALPNNLMPGNILEDRYRIVQQIGQGGFGRTYLCENLTRFNEPCVLKEFAPQVQGTYALDKAKKLFEREASVLHNLAHPQIPRFRELFELKTGSQGLFLVQDYVAGQTYRYLLAARQNHNRLFSEAEVRQLLIDTLPVLDYIHSLGVIHRDIAPDNLMLRSSDNLPVLIDFGGVKQIAVNAEIQATGNTEVPTCLGKVGYAPHEQMQRGTVSANSDLYALAATSLVLLTGKEPTELIDPQSLTWNWRSAINLESNLGMLFDRMLQPNPASRYQSASEVLIALKQQVAVPQMPVTLPLAQPHNSAIGTVVISPGVNQKQVNPNSPSATGNDSSFLTILGRSWIGILGLGAVGAAAWAGNSIFNKPNIPTPTSPIISTPSTPAPSTAPVTEATPNSSPDPNGTSGNTNVNSTSTGNDSSNSSSNASKVIIKPSSDKSNNETSKGSVAASPDGSREINSRRPSRDNTDSRSSSRTDTQRARRNASNTTPAVRRNNSSTEEEPAFKPPKIEEYDSKPRPAKVPSEDKPVSKPPKVEEFDVKPRSSKPVSEDKPAAKSPKVEEFDVKPRSSKPVSEDKPAAKSPKVEEFEVKPRRQSASKPENPAQNSKKPAKKAETGGEEDDQLF
jgi:serine/threonine protein kinase